MGGSHGNKIGGPSVTDEVLTGVVTKGVLALLNGVEHKPLVQQMLRSLPPLATLAMDPVVLQTAISAMPDFGHPEIAHMLKDVLVQSAHALEDMTHDAKQSAEERTTAGITAGLKVVGEKKYAVQGRCFHRMECGELPAPRAQTAGKKGEAPKPRNDFRELSLAEAISQGYYPCMFCILGAGKVKIPQVEKPAVQAKPDPLRIMSECKDEKAKNGFQAMLNALDANYKKKVWSALKHLSSEQEFIGMMAAAGDLKPEEYPAFVDQLDDMLQMDEGKRAETLGILGSIGNMIAGGGEMAAGLVSSFWNAKIDPAKKPADKASDGEEEDEDDFGLADAFMF